MVKIDSKWGTVCDDNFTISDAEVACSTLGFKVGSYAKYDTALSEASVPILMDDVSCPSNTDNFIKCSYSDDENCNHDEDVLLTCEAVCIEIFSNCEDCKMCQDSDSGYSRSWRGDPIRTFLKFIKVEGKEITFGVISLINLIPNENLRIHYQYFLRRFYS